MTTLLALAVLMPQAQAQVKYWTLDDFTETPWTHTLFFGQSIAHAWLGLKTCPLKERQVNMAILNNPNNTSLTYSFGNHEQKFSSPLQLTWEYWLEYGNEGTLDIDLSLADRFYLDFTTNPPGRYPDFLTMSVMDWQGRGGTVSWYLRSGGVFFTKDDFPDNVNWKQIHTVRVRQEFSYLPNPLQYSATRFYCRLLPGVQAPGNRANPLSLGG